MTPYTWRNFVNGAPMAREGQMERFVSSEGALIAIAPYDYPQQRPLFELTPVLNNNLNINAMMTLVIKLRLK